MGSGLTEAMEYRYGTMPGYLPHGHWVSLQGKRPPSTTPMYGGMEVEARRLAGAGDRRRLRAEVMPVPGRGPLNGPIPVPPPSADRASGPPARAGRPAALRQSSAWRAA